MNYNIPFARHSSHLYAKFIHEWKLNVIGVVQSGAPLTVTSGANVNGATGPNYPNLIGDPNGAGTYTPVVQHRGLPIAAELHLGQRREGHRLWSWEMEFRYQPAARVPAARAPHAPVSPGIVQPDEYPDAGCSEYEHDVDYLWSDHVDFRQPAAAAWLQIPILTGV